MRLKSSLFAATAAAVLSGWSCDGAYAQQPLYWQCVAPGTGSPEGGFCPVGQTYPLPAQTADGGQVTLGAKADAAYAGSGAASVVSALKGIYAALVAPLPAGTNAIGYVGGFNSGPISVTPTVSNSAYTANYAIGGLQTIAAFRTTARPSGLFNYISATSKGGTLTSMVVYGFTKSPASTCTDKATFALSSTDLPYLIPGFPVTLTPATSVGTTQSTASLSIPVSTNNQDSPSLTQNLYFCAVTTGTPTPASTTDLVFSYAIIQD